MVGMRPLATSSGWSSGVVSAGKWNHWQFATRSWRGRVEIYLWPEGPGIFSINIFVEKVLISGGVLLVGFLVRFVDQVCKRLKTHDSTLPFTVFRFKINPSHLVVGKMNTWASCLFSRTCTVSPLLKILENSLRHLRLGKAWLGMFKWWLGRNWAQSGLICDQRRLQEPAEGSLA